MALPLLWLDETPSTNAYLKERFLRGDITAETAVAAHRQTAGRGRLGRTWECAPSQALTLSVLFPRALPAAVTLAVGVAVCRAIARVCGAETQLKWPNDIVCNNRKIGGILCEGLAGERCATVVGIGLNVAQPASFFAEKGLPHGGSLCSEAGVTVALEVLADAVTAAVKEAVETLETAGFSALKAEFSARCITLQNEVCVLSPTGERMLCGTATDVDDDGQLLLTDETGAERTVCAGEVSVRGVYGYV